MDRTFNKDSSYTPVSTLYVGLCTADPGEAATGASCSEVPNSNNYGRAVIAFDSAASRLVNQTSTVTFNQATGSWGTCTHFVVTDNGTYGSGNVLAYGALASSQAVGDGDTPSIAAGELDVSINAGEVSNYLANTWLDWLFNEGTFTAPTTYVALVDTIIVDGDTGSSISEPGSGSYARVLVYDNTSGTPDWELAVQDDPYYTVDNDDDISFPTATGDWGTMVGVAVCDAATNGNLLMYDNDMTDKAVNTGNTAKFPANDLDMSLQ